MSLKKVRGFPDCLEQDCWKQEAILSVIFKLLKNFHFSRVNPPVLEYAELFSRTLGANSDIVNKEMFTVKAGSELLTLRPEGTAGVARMFVTQKLYQKLPLRWFYYGPMFRYERPQKARFRQFHQLGLELLGESELSFDVEILSLSWLLIHKLNLQDQVSLQINTLGSIEERQKYLTRFKNFLSAFKKDLSLDSQKRLQKNPLRIWDSKDKKDQEILKTAPLLKESLARDSLDRQNKIQQRLQDLGIPFVENSKLVRGLDYYNDLVFEWTSPNLGSQSAFLAGGRYDGLIQQLGGLATPAVGWALGLERLQLLCAPVPEEKRQLGIVCLGEEFEKKAHQLAYELRREDFSVYYYFSGNFSKQMKRISEKCHFALIYGQKEQAKQEIILKNLKTAKQIVFPVADLKSKLKSLFI